MFDKARQRMGNEVGYRERLRDELLLSIAFHMGLIDDEGTLREEASQTIVDQPRVKVGGRPLRQFFGLNRAQVRDLVGEEGLAEVEKHLNLPEEEDALDPAVRRATTAHFVTGAARLPADTPEVTDDGLGHPDAQQWAEANADASPEERAAAVAEQAEAEGRTADAEAARAAEAAAAEAAKGPEAPAEEPTGGKRPKKPTEEK